MPFFYLWIKSATVELRGTVHTGNRGAHAWRETGAAKGETGRLAMEEPWGKLGGRLGLCWLASSAATSRGCSRPSGTGAPVACSRHDCRGREGARPARESWLAGSGVRAQGAWTARNRGREVPMASDGQEQREKELAMDDLAGEGKERMGNGSNGDGFTKRNERWCRGDRYEPRDGLGIHRGH